jgi:hypothetical protein
MESQLLRRPLVGLLSGRSQCLFFLNTAAKRHESSYRRTKQRLNIKPESSFLLSNNSPQQDHVIFNPPSSAPSVLHTPIKFLPKDDKRRQLLIKTATQHFATTPSILPPAVKSQTIPDNHLSQKEISELQQLRLKDPDEWTERKLARKFKCTQFFVKVCIRAVRPQLPITEGMQERRKAQQAVFERWGPRRRKAREERGKRTELALRGD